MSEETKKYRDLMQKRKKLQKKINQLEKEKLIKQYRNLMLESDSITEEEIRLYSKMKEEEYHKCNHILICSKIDSDPREGRTYEYFGCMKCGVDNSVLTYQDEYLNKEEKVMKEYVRKNPIDGLKLDYACDIHLARAIYQKLKQVHPKIHDKKAAKYFEIALDHIRMIPVSKEREESRAKRLLLSPNFKRWNGEDVSH